MAVPPRSTPATTSTVFSSSVDVYAAQLIRVCCHAVCQWPDFDSSIPLKLKCLPRSPHHLYQHRDTLVPPGFLLCAGAPPFAGYSVLERRRPLHPHVPARRNEMTNMVTFGIMR